MISSMTFYLGTHQPHWLKKTDVPLFVCRNTLRRYRNNLPRALGPWVLDSGGFSEIKDHGFWRMSAKDYAAEVIRYRDGVGRMVWAAPQDWMCEPMIRAKSGLTVQQHQVLTVRSVVELRGLVGDIVAPVLQGWVAADYARHAQMYEREGFDLRAEPTIGVGTVCKRESIADLVAVLTEIHAHTGANLHGFGVKGPALPFVAHLLTSADSMAWSYEARRQPVLLPGHDVPGGGRPRGHKNCANCFEWAMRWRQRQLHRIGQGDSTCKAA